MYPGILLSGSVLLLCSHSIGARDSPCEHSLSIVLERSKIRRLENDSVLHDGLLYPTDAYWIANDTTYGCICDIKYCIRKCCQDDEVLNDDERPECVKISGVAPDLRLAGDQLAPEIRSIGSVGERFAVIKNRRCPAKTFKLDPDSFNEDRFTLQPNGSLITGEEVLTQTNYCMDWHESFQRITVLKCFEPVAEPLTPETIYHIGMILSIPFLFVTFMVYAIIPELRNIYGKTLMCYVACLVSGYFFLVITGL